MEFRSLRPEELDDWACHCAEVFSGDSKDYFMRHFLNDPWRDFNGIFVALDNGKIVSTVRVFRRMVWILGDEVPLGAIGEVSTKAAYRGRGLAGTLLEMAIAWMQKEGMAVSALYTGAYDFYRKYGWECIPKQMKRFDGVPGQPCEGRGLAPSDLPRLTEVEAASVKQNWMIARREPGYWQSWVAAEMGRGFAAVESGRIVAWLLSGEAEDSWEVREFRALPGYEDRFSGLCSLAAETMGRLGQAFTAPAWMDARNGFTNTYESAGAMVRLIAPFKAGGVRIGSTRELIDTAGDYRDNVLDHF